MGHQRLGELPTTRKWQAVVTLIGGGADVRDVAAATADAAEAALAAAAADPALHHAFWLLARIPLAAREPDFAAGLGRLGLAVGDRPTLVEVCSAMVEAVDDAAREHGRTDDFSEMATLAAAESLSGVAGARAPACSGPPTAPTRPGRRSTGSRPTGRSPCSRAISSRG